MDADSSMKCINGCMERSMNGRKLPLDGAEMKAMMSYLHFLSTGIPVKPNLEADFPARKNKPVDAVFAPYTPGFSAERHKYGPWQAILAAREKGGCPEWHLLKLFRMPIFSDARLSDRARLGK